MSLGHLVAIVGPTAIGKSRLALHLAQTLNGEIASADSRQVYRGMDIGTAKPGQLERSLVPHHLIDLVDPDETFSLGQYLKLAYQVIDEIQQRGKLALLVGGTGQYVWALLEGWQIPEVPPDAEFRRRLREKAAGGKIGELYRELMKVDPAAASKIDPRNVRRVIRALEVCRSAGVPFSRLQGKKTPPFQTLIIGLTADRAGLYRRTDSRVEQMMAQGLVEEVRRLVDAGYSLDLPAMSGVGYKQVGLFLRGALTLDTAVQQIKFETHRIARHQYSWFRLTDSRIKWFDVKGEVEPEITAQVAQFISQ